MEIQNLSDLTFLCTSPTLLLLIYGRGPPIGWLPYLLFVSDRSGRLVTILVLLCALLPLPNTYGLLPLNTLLSSKNALKTLKNAGF